MILGKTREDMGKSFKLWFTRVQKRLTCLFGSSNALQRPLTPEAMGCKGGGGLCGRVHKLAEMGWNPDPMIQIIVEMPDTWKVVIGMNGD